MLLDDIYKSRLSVSHAEGLQAVFEAGLAAGKEEAAKSLHAIIVSKAPEAPQGQVLVGDA